MQRSGAERPDRQGFDVFELGCDQVRVTPASREDEADTSRRQAPSREPERGRGGSIEPLHVVHGHQDAPAASQSAKGAEERDSGSAPVGRDRVHGSGIVEEKRGLECPSLRLR
jgi:hypothetical protein